MKNILRLQHLPARKKLVVKRIFSTLIFLLTVQLNYGQITDKTYSFSLPVSSLEEAVINVQKYTGIPFAYTEQLHLEKINSSAHTFRGQAVETIVKQLLKGTSIDYKISAGSIILQREKKTKSLKGKVSDNNGEPLPGVSVRASGFKTSTDADGYFDLKIWEDDQTVQFSAIGYEMVSRSIQGKDTVFVQMGTADTFLDEVVVIGYGTQKRRAITGSISSLKSEAYNEQPMRTLESALQGRVPGVQVSFNSGAPGSAAKVRIRGANSINAGNEPLYVVNGVALSSMRLQDLNVNDIQSFEVLKDAAATAIYGSRGANGVILITTKGGERGATKINYATFLSASLSLKKIPLLNARDYALQSNRIAGATIFADPDNLNTTDWQDLIYRNTFTQNHQISLSGGTEKHRYYLSGNYIDQPGIVINTASKRYSINVGMDGKLGKKISYAFNLMASRSNDRNNENLIKAGAVSGALAWGPAELPFREDGTYRMNSVSTIWPNPLILAKEKQNDYFSNSGVISGKLDYDITPWLRLTVNGGLDFNTMKSAYLNNQWFRPTAPGSGQGYYESYTLQNSNNLTFHKNIAEKHEFSLSAIVEGTSSNSSSFNANGSNLTTMNNGYHNLALNSSQGISSAYSEWGILSYIGRLGYVYNNRYLINATYRADGSSKFANHKWGYFPSIGLAWILSEEKFLRDQKTFSNLKLRASWGKTGNQSIDPYTSLGLLTDAPYSFGTTTLYNGYSPGAPRSDLQWESTEQLDVGLDIGFLNDRFTATIDLYKKMTRSLLLQVPVPIYNGGGNIWRNLGAVDNEGLEIGVGGAVLDRQNVSWDASFNISLNRNKVVDIGDNDIIYRPVAVGGGIVNTNIQVVKVGDPLGSFYLIPWTGVYSEDDDILGYKAGDNRYTDVSGNGSIGYEDRVLSGSAMPKVTWGLNNTFRYKALSLSFLFQGLHGQKTYNGIYASVAAPTSENKYPTLAESGDHWSPENPGALWADPASKTSRNYVESTLYLQDGSFIRLKNVSLSYDLKRAQTGFADIKLSISGQNLWTITDYKGYDPEVSSLATTRDSDSGIDFGAYPIARTLTFGANISF